MSKQEDCNGNKLCSMDSIKINEKQKDEKKIYRHVMVDSDFDPDEFEDYDDLTRLDLVTHLKESEKKCIQFEKTNKKLETLVNKLEQELCEQASKCKSLEDDRSFLRTNIRKVSANWFDKKARLSEGESDQHAEPNTIESERDGHSSDNSGTESSTNEHVLSLYSKLKRKNEKLELSERRCFELGKRLSDFEKLIGNQEVIIHGMKDQLNTYFNDNQNMSSQLSDINKLFSELEVAKDKKVAVPGTPEPTTTENNPLPTESDFQDMAGSVSKTYLNLKELIYEKKSLVTEIERLQILNVELQLRVTQQESRLTNVTDALQTTWLLVSNLKDEHAKIHSQETILRYELREKREILNNLRVELESSREQWLSIRQKNMETEQEWKILREELDRRRKPSDQDSGGENPSVEELEGACSDSPKENTFEPPIDLLLDMAVEYGVVNADDTEPSDVIALIEGQDIHAERLQNLEDQCSHLYHKLMSSTTRAFTLASHLSSLHDHYGNSDTDTDYSDEDDADEDDNNEAIEHPPNNYDSPLVSPDSEGYDTAYVSENEGAESLAEVTTTVVSENASAPGNLEKCLEECEIESDLPDDLLSKKLINFLPKKIEILRGEIKKLEGQLQAQQEEKAKSILTLTVAMESERRQRKQAEDQLKHLGKCVDELKLERNGKIAEVELEFKKKMEEVRLETEVHENLKAEHESLNDKFDQRGLLLQVTMEELQKSKSQINDDEKTIIEVKEELESLRKDIRDIKSNKQTDSNSASPLIVADESRLTSESVNDVSLQTNVLTPINLNSTGDFINCLKSTCWAVPRGIVQFTNPQSENQCHSKTIVLTPNLDFHIPFYLSEGATLIWTIRVKPEGIKFRISFIKASQTTNEPQKNENASNISPLKPIATSTPTSTEQAVSAEAVQFPIEKVETSIKNRLNDDQAQSEMALITPMFISTSTIPTRGKLTARAEGTYKLIFQNPLSRSQEIFFEVWRQDT